MRLTPTLYRDAQPTLPSHWPDPLHPDVLATIEHPTPFFACDLETICERYREFVARLPGVCCHYAVKCNSSRAVLGALAELGCGSTTARASSRSRASSASTCTRLAPCCCTRAVSA